jgi:hypothetical protein
MLCPHVTNHLPPAPMVVVVAVGPLVAKQGQKVKFQKKKNWPPENVHIEQSFHPVEEGKIMFTPTYSTVCKLFLKRLKRPKIIEFNHYLVIKKNLLSVLTMISFCDSDISKGVLLIYSLKKPNWSI